MTSKPIGNLATFHRNPRRGDVAKLCESLIVHGQYRPIVVNKGSLTGRKNEVLAGNHLLMAFRTLAEAKPDDPRWSHLAEARRYEPGDDYWNKIDVYEVDVDEDQAKRIVAVDNRTAELGGYDDELLAELLAELPELEGTGYTGEDLDDLVADVHTAAARAMADAESTPAPGGGGGGGGETVVDRNTLSQKGLDEKLAGYSVTETRSVILAYSGETYVWVVEQLAELGRRYETSTNAETVKQLIADTVGAPAP